MVDALAHRGPDGSGLWVDGPLGLGHRMLWTTSESHHEQLPLTSRCGGYIITADARIDNRDALIARLRLNDRPREQIGDSEIILAAYTHWGERCPQHLLGDFAFAIWDARRRQLFCARDYLGVKPLYYFASDQLIALASEVGPLLTLAEVPRRLDEGRVAEYLISRLEGESDSNTFYAHIRRLPGGSWLAVGPEATAQRRYRGFEHLAPLTLRTDAEYVEAFRDVFDQAVRCRLRSAAPLGAMLSGGVDSTAIVCLAERAYAREGRRLPTFSMVGADPATCPETPFLATLPAGLALERNTVPADHIGRYLAGYSFALEQGDDPFTALQTLPLGLYTAARAQGIRVMLDGVDGDIVASLAPDYPAYLARGGRWLLMVAELDGAARFSEQPLPAVARDNCVWPLLPGALRRRWTALRRYNRHVTELLQPDFVQRNRLAERIEEWQIAEDSLAPTLRAGHIRAVSAGWLQSALERYDHAAAGMGIEARHPLLDQRVVELCVALPPELKVRHGWTKAVLREAMAGVLPEPVRLRRDRANPSDDFVRHLLPQFADLLEATFSGDLAELSSVLRPEALRALYRRYRQAGAPEDAHQLWMVLAFSRWWRRAIWDTRPQTATHSNCPPFAPVGRSNSVVIA
ncbi:MAG: hypothetical protein HGA45_39740 [Chloroflexales bacterium]|nr:hypothetical protein [Chloroflexales bacterium]